MGVPVSAKRLNTRTRLLLSDAVDVASTQQDLSAARHLHHL